MRTLRAGDLQLLSDSTRSKESRRDVAAMVVDFVITLVSAQVRYCAPYVCADYLPPLDPHMNVKTQNWDATLAL